LGICIDKTSLYHRPDHYIGFTHTKLSPHILQQNCANDCSGYLTTTGLIPQHWMNIR